MFHSHNQENIVLPKGQQWIIDVMIALGYPIHEAGICFGLTGMFMHAVLNGKLDEFNDHLRFIFENAKDINPGKIREINKKGRYVPIKNANKILETAAFLEGVEINFNPTEYVFLFDPKQKPIKQDHQRTIFLTQANTLNDDKQEQLTRAGTFCGIYNQENLNHLLKELLPLSKEHQPICYVIGSNNHSIAIAYANDSWIVYNPNFGLPKIFKPEHQDNKIAKHILNSFKFNETSNADHIAASTYAFVSTNNINKNKIEEALITIQKNEKIHDKNKIKITDENKSTWLHYASKSNNAEAAKIILNEPHAAELINANNNDVKFYLEQSPLLISSVTMFINKDSQTIIELFLKKLKDENIPIQNKFLLLQNAARNCSSSQFDSLVDTLQLSKQDIIQNIESIIRTATAHANEEMLNKLKSYCTTSDLKNKFYNVRLNCSSGLKDTDSVYRLIQEAKSDFQTDSSTKDNASSNKNSDKDNLDEDIDMIFSLLKQLDETHPENVQSSNIKQKSYYEILKENQKIEDGSLLILAAKRGNKELVRELMQMGAPINQIDINSGNTAIMEAAMAGHTHVIAELMKYQPNLSIQNKNGDTLFHLASTKGFDNIIEMFLDLDSFHRLIEIRNYQGKSPSRLAQDNNHVSVVDLIDNHNTLLHWACEHGDLNTVINQIELRPNNISERNISLESPLVIAMRNGHTNIVSYIVEKMSLEQLTASNTDLRNSLRGNSFHLACAYNMPEIAEKILARCPEILNVKSNNEQTALMMAVNHAEIMRFLLHNHADLNLIDKEGNTVLHYACSKADDTAIIKLLIQTCPSLLNKPNNNGVTPLMKALSSTTNPTEIIRFLLNQKNINIFNFDSDFNGVVVYACNGNQIHIAKHILLCIINEDLSDREIQGHFNSILKNIQPTNDNHAIFMLMLKSNQASMSQVLYIIQKILITNLSHPEISSAKLAEQLLNYIEKYHYLFSSKSQETLNDFLIHLKSLENTSGSHYNEDKTKKHLLSVITSFAEFFKEQAKNLSSTLIEKTVSEDKINRQIIKQLETHLSTDKTKTDTNELAQLIIQLQKDPLLPFDKQVQLWGEKIMQKPSSQGFLSNIFSKPKNISESITESTKQLIEELKTIADSLRKKPTPIQVVNKIKHPHS